LNSIARQTTSAGKRIFTITSTNGNKNAISSLFSRLSVWLFSFRKQANAERWDHAERWDAFVRSIFPGVFGVVGLPSGYCYRLRANRVILTVLPRQRCWA
jgi:hypothetical protein